MGDARLTSEHTRHMWRKYLVTGVEAHSGFSPGPCLQPVFGVRAVKESTEGHSSARLGGSSKHMAQLGASANVS